MNRVGARSCDTLLLVAGLIAIGLFASSARANDGPTHREAYELLLDGRSDEAVRILTDLEAANDPGGLEVLGYMHFEGVGVPANEALGADYFRRSAELGDTTAMADFGLLLVLGRGVGRDVERGLDWLRRSAELGESLAHVMLGELYYYRGDPIAFDLDSAFKWFTSAHRLGDLEAARPLGEIRLFAESYWGRSDLRDCATGEALLREALLKHEDWRANLPLGWAYYDGLTCERAPEKAMPFFRAAETHRIEGAARALGIAYGEGVAVQRARLKAVHWFALALRRGDPDARPWLDWAIAGLDPPLSLEELRPVRGLQILFDSGAYALPEGTPPKPEARQG